MPTPEEEMLSAFESIHIQYFQQVSFNPLHPHRGPRFYVFYRFASFLSSKMVRYATILLSIDHRRKWLPFDASFQDRRDNEYWEIECKHRYYRHAIEAINNHAYHDIVDGCYAMCLYQLCTLEPRHEFLKHFSGFLLAFEILVASPTISQEELTSLKCMYLNILDLAIILSLHLAFYKESREYLELIRLMRRTADKLDVANDLRRMACVLTAKINLGVISLFLQLDTTMRIQRGSGIYDEREYVTEAVRGALRSLSGTLQSPSCRLLIEDLCSLKWLPFNLHLNVQQVQIFNDFTSRHPQEWIRIIFFSCLYYLQYFLVFEEQDVGDTSVFGAVEAAIIIARVCSIFDVIFGQRYRGVLRRHFVQKALFIAGLVLASLHRPDGMPPFRCSN